MGSSSMKVHPFARGSGLWDHHHQTHNEQHSSLSLGCKRLRPLAPKLNHPTESKVGFDLKTFIKSDKLLLAPGCDNELEKKDSAQQQVETQQNAGGTRWNPTQEQIGILEKLYRGGMRTPNAQQIEQITQQLSKYGKIEGKNVFYWFQNHKARERQKMKRSILGLSHRSRTPPPLINTSISLSFLHTSLPVGVEKGEVSPYKRNCTSWAFDFETSSSSSEENNVTILNSSRDHDGCKLTLELFPLHPELRQMI